MQQRNLFFDMLKGFAIYLVVFAHCIQCINKNATSNVWLLAIIMFHMPLFMAVSGFFFYPSVTKCSFSSFAKRKFQRLYLPSLCWGMITAFSIGGAKFLRHDNFDPNYFLSITFTGLWFLTVLYILSLIGSFIHNCIHQHKWLCWIIIYVAIYFLPAYWMVNELKFLMPFFVGAIYLRKCSWDKIPFWLFIISFGAFLFLMNIYTFENSLYTMPYFPYSWSYHYLTVIRLLSGITGIICSLYLCKWFMKLNVLRKIFTYIGIITLPIYVLHQKFLMCNNLFQYTTDNILIVILLSIIDIILSIIFYKLLVRNKKFALFLFGEKR